MDPVTLTFYALVCGVLSLCAPSLGAYWKRLVVGAIVGVVAATILPIVRGMI